MNRPILPKKRDYLVAAAGFFLLTCIVVGGCLIVEALGWKISDEHRSIMQAARMLAGR